MNNRYLFFNQIIIGDHIFSCSFNIIVDKFQYEWREVFYIGNKRWGYNFFHATFFKNGFRKCDKKCC